MGGFTIVKRFDEEVIYFLVIEVVMAIKVLISFIFTEAILT